MENGYVQEDARDEFGGVEEGKKRKKRTGTKGNRVEQGKRYRLRNKCRLREYFRLWMRERRMKRGEEAQGC